MADAAAKLRKAENAAQLKRAEADVASAQASLTRAQIESSGNRIERNWETGETTVVPIPSAATSKTGSSVSGRRRGKVS